MTAPPISSSLSAPAKLSLFARDIKISHTVFALPWAIFSTFLAARGWPGIAKLALIAVCMVSARTVAMAANRLVDAKLDALNPRTARRAIPSGALPAKFVAMILALCAVTFILATAGFWFAYRNPWPLLLSGPVLFFLCGYPFLKRFTRLCHYYLGAALALAPVCAWVAITGSLAVEPLLMAGAVLTWTAAFDIIYACQDYESDVQTGIFSVPAKVGIPRALWIARITHGVSIALLIALAKTSPLLGPIFYCAVAIAVALLLIEHSLVKPNDLSKVGLAFFTINGIISVVIGALGIADVFW